MKFLLSFAFISVASAASQNGNFIRGGSSAADEAAATHVVPGDIFAGLLNNNWSPDQYCPRGTKYKTSGSEWPPEDGCYPGTGSIPAGYPKCCDKGNCPNNGRPLCENSMSAAPAYCADMGPDPSCYQLSWPRCCVENGPSCPSNPPPCDLGGGRRTCNKSSQCYSDEFCMKQDGNCGQTGQCVIMPDKCSSNYNPVCGCDNKTYDNACLASVRGRTTVKFYGTCSGDDNRGTCNKSSDCYSDEYCYKQSCGQTGQCVARPSQCSNDNNPVCGCDNKTYSNACLASSQGRTTVKFNGTCSNRGTCNSNNSCQSNEYCDFPDGACGGNGGVCTPIPSGQDCNGVTNDKVCGCDDVQYKNSCKANQSRTSIQNMGNCFNVNEDFAFE